MMHKKRVLAESIKVSDRVALHFNRKGDPWSGRGHGGPPMPVGAPPIKKEVNVLVTLRDEPDGKIIEARSSHNIFLNYGREWLAELVSLNTAGATFRTDRIRYMAYGIGGTSQLLSATTIQSLYAGWSGYTTPAQSDVDPTVTGLEYPVEVSSSDYYDDVKQPATFPQAGIVRFTAIAGYNEISYSGGPTSVPLSEIGLFTEGVTDQTVAPEAAPPERYMVAYNTFDTLSKTASYVLQADWELRFS
jgi:hypothetical protein